MRNESLKVTDNSASHLIQSVKTADNGSDFAIEQIKKINAANNTTVMFLTREKAEEIIQMAQDYVTTSGKNANDLNYFKQYNSNPVFKELALRSLESNINTMILTKMTKQTNN